MCGIVYSKSLVGKPVNRTILNRYLDQRTRGTDGFGFYTPETNRLTHNVREGRILSLLRRNKKATEILFHHRMPTSTMNVRNACHPFSTKDYFKHNYIVVHNGVLWNESKLKPIHEQRGIDYVSEQEDGSFNDSEALAYDLAMYLEGEVESITAEGSIAFVCIQRDKKGKAIAVYFGRNSGNPLIMKRTLKSLTLSSEGEGILIDPHTMYRFDYVTGEVTRTPCRFPSSTSYAGTGYWEQALMHDDDMEEFLETGDWGIQNGYDGATNEDTRRYFEEEDREQARTQYVAHEIKRLMSENEYEIDVAIDEGYKEIQDLERIENTLHNSVEVTNTASDEDVEKYYRIGDRLYYLRQAVKELERGGNGESQMGFRFRPDHSNPKPPSRLIIDPETNQTYYSYV